MSHAWSKSFIIISFPSINGFGPKLACESVLVNDTSRDTWYFPSRLKSSVQGLFHSCLWYWSKDIMPGDVAAVLQPWGNKHKRMVKLKSEKVKGFGWAHLIAKAVSAAASYQICYKGKLLFSWPKAFSHSIISGLGQSTYNLHHVF